MFHFHPFLTSQSRDAMFKLFNVLQFVFSVAEEVKSVDILAALPTPPHNQNEDIRYNM